MKLCDAEVLSIIKVSVSWYLLTLTPEEVLDFRPGSFVYLRLAESSDPLLRRPFSVHDFQKSDNKLQILFQDKGKGTAVMKAYRPGDKVNFIGPLGNGFSLDGKIKRAALVGGGIGVAPLFFLARQLRKNGTEFDFFLGASGSAIIPEPDFFAAKKIGPLPATDDGSLGFKGTVTALFREHYKNDHISEKPDMVFACGPLPMLRSLYTVTGELDIPVQVSLEERMACGVGACLGCVCRIKDKASGLTGYERVCKEGPVFAGEAVFYDEC